MCESFRVSRVLCGKKANIGKKKYPTRGVKLIELNVQEDYIQQFVLITISVSVLRVWTGIKVKSASPYFK